MNRLTKKFMMGIIGILIFMVILSVIMNSFLVECYYIEKKKQDMDTLCKMLEVEIAQGKIPEEAMEELEDSEEVLIIKLEPDSNQERLNDSLRTEMKDKGVGFQKFWLWEEDYKTTMETGRMLRIYNQGKLNYSLMVEYMQLDSGFYAMAMIIPEVSETIRIINTGMLIIMAVSMLIASIFIVLLVKRITKPLNKMRQFADDLADQKFCPIVVCTNDELEDVADSMNEMGSRIQDYQRELTEKNRQMEQLLDDVAHELKTPVALVKVYAAGIKDGLDDGSFLDTIIRKNNMMGEIVERLLLLSRMKQKELTLETVMLDEVLSEVIKEYSVFLKPDGPVIRTQLEAPAVIWSSREMVFLILSNLVSNAVKYAVGTEIHIRLQSCEKGYLFEIENEAEGQIDFSQLWEPFYVGEKSRNKGLSGTGLGLAIVQKSGERMGYLVDGWMEESKITFQVLFQGRQMDSKA